MGVTFNEATKALFDGNNFPVVATINADGSVQTSVVWAKRDGDTVLFATVRGRLKERNLQRDPRVSLSVFDLEDPLKYVEVRGRAEITEEGGRELINELSHKYDGKDFRTEPPEVVRVVVRVVPDKVTGYAA
ncbi:MULTISPECIES: PPOX class F420-dependent oxidoreductase [unclassified Amycolatopsis]|uniref:PPOX class F420-dependent oxidoreductase n=1 Tax=unclassified Amycolatopsis TaxID=2618356 RepID=UPI0028749FD1|nr:MULTISPECIES: PPOX class F420-dependent oxidoreductase [unclassified Amycolatopsis]MDS0133599.1 PPOX class F420-dependent oxidoreductase [Amycolatopsis sp. 505]MDS0148556.1 PPOX class F420-dependent oxidoreductase [Amycolatopsis sp. CM201R]